MTYTDSVRLIWRIGAYEAAWRKHSFIEKEHIFIGLCKTHEFLREEVLQQAGMDFSREMIEEMKSELAPVVSGFRTCSLNPRYLRRSIRRLMGKGNYERGKDEKVIHRSKECKGCFDRAKGLAEEEGTSFIYPVYLFKAILLKPGLHIKRAIEDLGSSPERLLEALTVQAGLQDNKPFPHLQGKSTAFLNRYGRDLTELARKRRLKPLIGRKKELLQMIRTLARMEKNNPLFIGEAGVGKTAIVEGLAQRIASKNIDKGFWDKRVIELRLSSVIAGTRSRGVLEERLLRIIDEARDNPGIILFLDEIHTMVRAGAAIGGMDVSDIMKPPLARGEIKVIGATTLDEYHQYMERDTALERRFQPILVEEPRPDETLEILKGVKGEYERHHGVKIPGETLKKAVELSIRYLPYRRLPDKAIDLLDKACAAVKITSVSFHDMENQSREEGTDGVYEEGPQSPYIPVSPDVVAEVVAEETGVPVGRLRDREADSLIRLAERLRERVIGQDEATEKVAQALKIARAGLKDPKRPLGVFLFLGLTGVGKTELAKALAEALFGSEDEIIRLDMSEYIERHSVARLIGSPPGYVGHEEGGQLTESLKRKPYSVVLLDEIEKAHPDVFDLFLQLFDEGRLTDGRGETVNAKEAIFIMTSNLGSEFLSKGPIGFVNFNEDSQEKLRNEMETRIKETFRPEFLNRIDEITLFCPLEKKDVKRIAVKMLEPLKKRLLKEMSLNLEIEDEALEFLVSQSYSHQEGARSLGRAIKRLIEVPLSEKLILGEFSPGMNVFIKVARGEFLIGSGHETF